MTTDTHEVIAALAVDYWKLLRSFERLACEMPEGRADRLQAQARFSTGRLQTHLEACGLKLATFDGQAIDPALPVVAINADEMEGVSNAIVESTVEPAVVAGPRVISIGRVIAATGAK